MSIFAALANGLGRLLSGWWLVVLVWLVNFALALPFAWVMARELEGAIGASLVHEKLRQGFDLGWFGELEAEAEGLVATFSPTLTGAGAFYANLEAWLDGGLFRQLPVVVALGLAYALTWALLLGGVLDRLSAQSRFVDRSGLLAACSRTFFPFVRLALLSGVLYYLIYRLQGWLFGLIEVSTRDVTEERVVFVYTLLAAVAVALLLGLVHVMFDYAKIATVVEGRRSMTMAALRGAGFVLAYPVRTLTLAMLLGLAGIALVALYAVVAPGSGQSSAAAVIGAFLVGQLFLAGKLGLRLLLLASETSLFESRSLRSGPSL
jgi:hypothetical protein